MIKYGTKDPLPMIKCASCGREIKQYQSDIEKKDLQKEAENVKCDKCSSGKTEERRQM